MKQTYQTPRYKLCPVCARGRIVRLADHLDADLVVLYPPQKAHAAQFFNKCPTCKQQIGISLRAS